MSGALATVETEELFRLMPADKAAALLKFVEALKVFAAATDKERCAAEIEVRFSPLGLKGLSAKSLYRKWLDFCSGGVLTLVDARTRRLVKSGLGANAAFLEHWHGLVLENRRKLRPAWSKLVREFTSGATIPGIGTWRDVYLAEFGAQPSQGEPCPWDETNLPAGWSYSSLRSLAPSKATRLAAHRGVGAAQMKYGLTVKKTRAGLKCCQVVEVDDMWYEHKVVFAGNSEPQRVVEYAAMDRLTGHVICHLAKPVRERADGTRETLRHSWLRYVYHYVLCVSGIPREGCVFMGEHGSAHEDAVFAAALGAINASREADGLGAVEFRAGSIMPRALEKGLPEAAAKGNPRHKGMIEQMHATLKNALGDVIGEVGGGRGIKPEAEYGMVAESRRLTEIANALEASRPGISGRLMHGFLQWTDFVWAAGAAHDAMDRRTVHDLEGWEKCGFMAGELQVAGSPHWQTIPAGSALSPERAAAIRALVDSGAAKYRVRKMSPAEAWSSRRGELQPVSAFYAPLVLGEDLAHVCRVGDKMTMTVRDADTGERYVVAAMAGGNTLPRGESFKVWVNPLDACKAYVSDLQGRFIGTAPVMETARADADADVPELQRQLGLRQRVIADEHRRLKPAIRRQLKARNDAAAANIRELGLEDPVVRQADLAAKAAALENAGTVDAAALIAPEAVDAPDAFDVSNLM